MRAPKPTGYDLSRDFEELLAADEQASEAKFPKASARRTDLRTRFLARLDESAPEVTADLRGAVVDDLSGTVLLEAYKDAVTENPHLLRQSMLSWPWEHYGAGSGEITYRGQRYQVIDVTADENHRIRQVRIRPVMDAGPELVVGAEVLDPHHARARRGLVAWANRHHLTRSGLEAEAQDRLAAIAADKKLSAPQKAAKRRDIEHRLRERLREDHPGKSLHEVRPVVPGWVADAAQGALEVWREIRPTAQHPLQVVVAWDRRHRPDDLDRKLDWLIRWQVQERTWGEILDEYRVDLERESTVRMTVRRLVHQLGLTYREGKRGPRPRLK